MTSQAEHFQLSLGKSRSNRALRRSETRRKNSSNMSDLCKFEDEVMHLKGTKLGIKDPQSPPPSYEDTIAEECDLRIALDSPGVRGDPTFSRSRNSTTRTRSVRSASPPRSNLVSYTDENWTNGKTVGKHEANGPVRSRRSSTGSNSRSPLPESFIVQTKCPVASPTMYSIGGYDCLCLPVMSTDQARTHMIDYERSKFKYKRGVAEKCSIKKIETRAVFRYALKTLFEARRIEDATKPYRGQAIDSPDKGNAPLIWQIPVETPRKFKNNLKKIPVPHTSYVRDCESCLGLGRTKCKECNTFGKTYCTLCMGGGSDPYSSHNKPCPRCSGQCYMRCEQCQGNGNTTCRKCQGRKSLLCYKQLVVEWIPRVDKHLDHVMFGNWNLLYDVEGESIFREISQSVSPITREAIESEDMRRASKKYIELHNVKGKEKVWQRQTVSVIAINTVNYEYKGKTKQLHFVGKNREIRAEKYPKRFPWNLR